MTDPQSKNHMAYKGGWVQDFMVALVFLTRLPIQPGFTFDVSALKTACRAFALIGLIVGGVSGTVYILAAYLGLPLYVSAILAVGAQIIVTGALHEDAIGDVADGFGGGADKEKKLAIMRDSRVGTYAVVALILFIGLKIAVLGGMPDPLFGFSLLIVAAALSRGLMTWALYLMPAAREDGLGHGVGRPDMKAPLVSTIICILIAIFILGPQLGAIALMAGIIGASLMGMIAKRQIGGQTGDVVGAIQQVAEIFILIACLAAI
ncbi:adenosylcobinamide-GDP ribazoletransferase [Sneathiella sp. HT1-7]|jgi:adenosylcobinamide-GDP ribazoletransferase|uniref:adenosylcobinamide-GDP ribazoletransferase n=1 Tax=Sneathiella sp. HT1-7 TaxID=2887192 RepID=UPI001D150734|nr:adenosylcobinamide-GDP ribazoletransferase [Sneathiella sp. HT1-7]MCC3304476.1 adenosylcobinamide-GDP ribazoletransferase [Sneathiella sp. HT1-7]